ncbi:unnamed protein product [Heligmosomoides polygyrus]|uniref:Cytochrome P450 n=1 Tax=Heligmosomoides polygyrus TaxID=6339 RepID=A0A183GL26_HELPZ|nr:unnamed protein product [Heligmosomoides polygyrus]
MFALLIALLTISVASYVWLFYRHVKRFPKGPTPLPIIGNLLSINLRKLHEDFDRISKDYGDIFTVWLPKPCVVVMNLESIKEAFTKKGIRTFLPPCLMFRFYYPRTHCLHLEGENWKEQRRTSLHNLRDFGMGKNKMEEQVLEDYGCLSTTLSYTDQTPLGVDAYHWFLKIFVANVINRTLYGFGYMEVINISVDKSIQSAWSIWYVQIKRIVKEDVEKVLQSSDDSHQPECFVHSYYLEMKTNPSLNFENLLNVCSDIFLAGQETTATTLRWAALILGRHQNEQTKIRQEILSVLGKDGVPSMSVRQRLPYTCAAALELQRFANIIAINVPHRTVRGTCIGSVSIPADTMVLGSLYSVMTNEDVYKDSDKFIPERFLMDDGVTPNKNAVEHLCPFSIGKRLCIGEGLAKMEIFIGLVTLLQSYKVRLKKSQG